MARRRISHVETHGRASKLCKTSGAGKICEDSDNKLFAEQRRTDVRLYMKIL